MSVRPEKTRDLVRLEKKKPQMSPISPQKSPTSLPKSPTFLQRAPTLCKKQNRKVRKARRREERGMCVSPKGALQSRTKPYI